jgi:hypothetical protein
MKAYAYALSALLVGAAFAAEAAAPVAATTAAPAKAKTMQATGKVVSTDAVGNTLIVEGRKKTQWTFAVPATAKITEGKKSISLVDVTVGTKVMVRYTKDGETMNAATIKVMPAKADSTKK